MTVGLTTIVLLAAFNLVSTAWYGQRVGELNAAQGHALKVARDVAELLALGQDALLHNSPRVMRQWSAVHADLVLAMQGLSQYLSAADIGIDSMAEITAIVASLPEKFAAISSVDPLTDLAIAITRRETLIDHMSIETRRVSDGVFRLSEILAQQRATLLQRQMFVQWLLSGLFLWVAGAVTYSIYRRILTPIERLKSTALKIQSGDMSARNALLRNDEFGMLSRNFDLMTDTIQSRQRVLQDSQRETAALYDTLNQHSIVSMADRHGHIIHANDAFCRISGYTREELLGQDHRIVNSGLQTDAFWREFWNTIFSGVLWRGEICNRAKDGSLYWVDSMVAPLLDVHGEIDRFISIRNDITARKHSEEALRVSAALLEESQQIAKVGGWELNLETGTLFWTAETYRIHEASPETFDPSVDAGVAFFLPESRKRIETALQAAMHQREPYDLELETLTTQGKRIHVRTTGKPWVVEDKVVRLSGIFQDITDRKQYEQELHFARRSAEQAAHSKGQFLANTSHEIRTPMNAILGLLQLLQTTELTARQRDYTNKTQGAAQSLLGLLNDILDFSKIEAGKMTLEREPFRIDRVMRSLSVVLSANVGSKDLEVLFDVDPDLPEVVLGDAMRLQQVLINLGANAVKFTAQGQVMLTLRKRSASHDAVTIEFAVQDSGIGIAAEHQAHIFSGFSQAEGSTTRRFGGTGLGLAICKRFVELMGGEIHVQSTVGVGSTFSFSLEFAVVSDIPDELVAPIRPPVQPQRVLVVDDNPTASALMQRMVGSWGWSADLAVSGVAALKMLAVQQPLAAAGTFSSPLIYLDGHLPGMDGWETTLQIRRFARQRQLPQPTIIMLSGHARKSLAQRIEKEQDAPDGYLVKPVTASMLLDAFMDAGVSSAAVPRLSDDRGNDRQLAGMRILVVEDNLINQQVAEELLCDEGAIVSLAANGRLGVDAVAAAAPQFDVVLMDIQMPVLDGYGATQLIRQELGLARLPIVAMTANAMASDRDACLAAGMNEHIGKPFDVRKLVALLIRVTSFRAEQTAPAAARASSPQVFANAAAQKALPSVPTVSFVPRVPGLDLNTALARMSGMQALYVRTAEHFCEILDTTMQALQQHLAAGDRKNLLMCLHTLKGNAGTLGASALADHAAMVESLCKQECDSPSSAACATGVAALGPVIESTRGHLALAIAQLQSQQIAPGDRDPASATASPEMASSETQSERTLAALRELGALAQESNLDVLKRFAERRDDISDVPDGFCERLERMLQDFDLQAASVLCSTTAEHLASLQP